MNAVTTTEASPVSVSRPDDSALLAVISRAASDPTIDIEKMERLLAMQERLVAKTAESLFNAAMNHAQGEMGRVATDSENNQTRSRYASYAALDRALRPVYTRHGFSLSFDTGAEAPEGFVRVQAYVSHSAGHTRTYGALMPADGKGAKGNDVMTKTHAFGAASQYGMRYLLKMIFNVAIGENDNDGNVDTGDTTVQEVLADLVKKLRETKTDETALAFWMSHRAAFAQDRRRYDEFKDECAFHRQALASARSPE